MIDRCNLSNKERATLLGMFFVCVVIFMSCGADDLEEDAGVDLEGIPDLDNPKVREQTFAEAIDIGFFRQISGLKSYERVEFYVLDNQPYTGWVKEKRTEVEVLWQVLNGKEHGLRIGWHDNQQLAFRGFKKDGEREGLFTEWYDNGQKRFEGTYKAGKKEGLWTEWYSNGQKWEEGTYKAGKKEGLWTEWYSNGQKKAEGTYIVDEKEGLWTYWNEDGSEKL